MSSSAQNLGIQYAMLHGCIYIGRLNKARTLFLDGKEDHTEATVFAAAEYIAADRGGEMELGNSQKRFRIRVEEITEDAPTERTVQCVRCGNAASRHGACPEDSPPGCGWTLPMVLAAVLSEGETR